MKISLDNGKTWQDVDNLLVRHSYKEEITELCDADDGSMIETGEVFDTKVELYFDFQAEQVSIDYWCDDEQVSSDIKTYRELAEEMEKE